MLGKRIRFYRRLNGYSQGDIADKLNKKSFTTIQKWEDGSSEPSIAEIKEMGEFFDIPYYALLDNDYVAEDDDTKKYGYVDIYEVANKLVSREDLLTLFDATKDAPKKTIKELMKVLKEKEQK